MLWSLWRRCCCLLLGAGRGHSSRGGRSVEAQVSGSQCFLLCAYEAPFHSHCCMSKKIQAHGFSIRESETRFLGAFLPIHAITADHWDSSRSLELKHYCCMEIYEVGRSRLSFLWGCENPGLSTKVMKPQLPPVSMLLEICCLWSSWGNTGTLAPPGLHIIAFKSL